MPCPRGYLICGGGGREVHGADYEEGGVAMQEAAGFCIVKDA